MTDRQPRKCSKWRKRVFDVLCKNHGPQCVDCGQPHKLIWRAASVYVNSEWGNARYTLVNCSSILEVDHIIELADGGSNDIENLQLLCVACHRGKTSQKRSARLKKIFADWREQQVAA